MISKKQIMLMHYSLPPTIGGVESIMKSMAELFAQKGYLVSVLAGKGAIQGTGIKTSIIPEIDPEHPHVREMQRIFKLGVLPDNFEYRVQNLERKIEAEIGNIEQIVIHNMMSMSDNLLATAALWNYINRYPDKKYYFYIHDLAWLMEDRKPFLFDKKPWNLLKTPLPFVKYVTISEYRRRQLIELYNLPRRQVTVIPNGINYAKLFKFEPATTQICDHLRLTRKYPLILLPVRLLPRKNLLRSLQIIKLLKPHFPELMAVITGPFYSEQSDNFAYQQIVWDFVQNHDLQTQVIFLSKVMSELNIPLELNQAIVRDLYFLSHLVLYLSSDEGFGLPLLEAGTARIPLVLSDLPVFREIVNNDCLILPDYESVEYDANRVLNYLQTTAGANTTLARRLLNKNSWEEIWRQYLQPLFEGESGGGGN